MTDHARLYVLRGPDVGRSFTIGPRAVIGRGLECDVRLHGTSISRRHARIERTAAGWFVLDLGSTNGVGKDGRRVDRAALADHDELLLGDVRVRFRLADEAPATAPAGGLRSEAARRELRRPRRDGGFLTAELDQRPWWVQVLLVAGVLVLAGLLSWGAFTVVRAFRGLS